MPLVAGARVGPYEIQSILGRGGMGEVYRARDSRLNRDVAVKVVRPAVANEADHLVRFGREAQLLAALNHPNIAQLHGLEDFSLQRLTAQPFGPTGTFSVWSPDSRYLIFSSTAVGFSSPTLVRRAVDGTGAAERLTISDSPQRAVAISPDGKRLVFEQMTPAFSYDLMMLELDDPSTPTATGTRQASPLLDTPSDERNASIAPDGRWMAYDSNKSGRFEIYVKPFPNVHDAEHQISTEGGERRSGRPTAASCSTSTGPP